MLDQPHALDPEDTFARPDEKEIATAITLTAAVSSNRQIVMQTYMSRDAALGDYHKVIDKLSAATDRQEAKAQLEGLLAEQALEEKTLREMENEFLKIPDRAEALWQASGKKGPYKPSPAEVTQRGQAEQGIRRFRESIVKRTAEISKCQAVIAKVD
jgi:hypothetical protein